MEWEFRVIDAGVSHSVMSDSLRPHAHQAPLSVEFSRQEYWSGLPLLSPCRCQLLHLEWINYKVLLNSTGTISNLLG